MYQTCSALSPSFLQRASNNKRNQFLAAMAELDFNWLRNLAVNSMVLTFTTDELNALADFYGSPVGRSILKKMPAYMGVLMPAMEKGLIEEGKKVLPNQ